MAQAVTRRKIIKSALAGTILAGMATSPSARSMERRREKVVVSGWGGATQRAQREAYFAPFTRDTGIEVVEQTYGSQGLARIKAQLAAGGAEVDVLDGTPFWAVIGQKQGLLERIRLPGLNPSHFIPGALDDYGFGYSTASWGIAYLKGARRGPANWREFWDIRAFPGRRAMFGPFVARHPEYALMAAGVALQDVNPLNDAKVERAFGKLAELQPHINVWYQTAPQCEQLLVGKQIDMVEFFNGRAFFLQDQGVPLEFVWNQAIINTPVFVVARDSPNRENAMKLLAYIAQPEPQAAFARLIFYGPTNTRALDLIKDQRTLERLPTYAPNFAQQLPLDGKWWGENQDRLMPRWSQLISR